MAMYLLFAFIVGVLFCFIYYLFLKNRNFWKNRNIPFLKPLPIFGNYKESILLKKPRSEVLKEICQQFPNEPYVGTFYGTSPALVIKDLSLLKLVMSKDFYYFNGREVSDYSHKEMFTRNLVLAHSDEWKFLRTNLTPLFSSMKLKNMFYLIKNCSNTLESLLAEQLQRSTTIEVGDMFSKYTIDCVTACTLGLCSDTMKKDAHKNPFTTVGDIILDTSDFRAIKILCRSLWPRLFYALGFKLLDDEVGEFFSKQISGVIKTREETNISKNDFVDLIFNWKKHKALTGDAFSNARTDEKKIIEIPVTDELLIAQCEILFGAGFESTAVTISFLLYELAKDKIAQEKVIEEVDKYFSKHENIEYECINMLPYFESCLDESLRLHPVFGFLTREVMHDYSLPSGLRLSRGDRIHISVTYMHYNPEYFPEPELFRPERFFGVNKKNVKAYSYMPFGEGPRICIGLRFSKMPVYAAFLKIFKNYRVELADNMPLKLSYNPKSISVTQPIGGIHIKFISRKA